MAKLRFLYGAMASSKTLRLLALAYEFQEKGIPFLIMKPSKDTRDGDNIIKSRAGLERECIMIDSDDDIYQAIKESNHILTLKGEKLKWILIDECQFLTEEQIDQLSDVVDYLDIDVMCYGLRTDFKTHLFPASKRLFEIADYIEEIKSTCSCGNYNASINARFDENGSIITEGTQILIGGNDVYKALCRKCWKDKVKEKYN